MTPRISCCFAPKCLIHKELIIIHGCHGKELQKTQTGKMDFILRDAHPDATMFILNIMSVPELGYAGAV